MTIFTIGHSTLAIEEFLELLRAHGVRRIVDVRRFPASHRHPHFGGDALSRTLAQAGVTYEHEPEFGGRRSAASRGGNDAWRSPAFRAYADHMATGAFQDALRRLIDSSAATPTAVMCAEAVPWRCHRQLIADALVARGIRVRNILTAESAPDHIMNAHAVVGVNGSLTYPADQTQPSLFASEQTRG